MTYTKTTLASRLVDIGLLRVDRRPHTVCYVRTEGHTRFVTCGQKATHAHVAELICTFLTNLLCQRAENFVASTRNLSVKRIRGKRRKRWADVVQRDALQIHGIEGRGRRGGDREKWRRLLKEVRAQKGL